MHFSHELTRIKSEAYLESSPTSRMGLFAKIVKGFEVLFSQKSYIVDVQLDSDYTSENYVILILSKRLGHLFMSVLYLYSKVPPLNRPENSVLTLKAESYF